MIKPGDWIGIVGGGQLGRMMIHAASKMGYKTIVFCNQSDSPASHVANQTIIASYDDLEAITLFAKKCSVATFEFENIPYKSVKKLEEETVVRPSWKALFTSQNRLREKRFIKGMGIKTAGFSVINDLEGLHQAVARFDHRCILKTTELGYDGKGQFRIDQQTNLEELWSVCKGKEMVLEQFVPFFKEISVVAARGVQGEFVPFRSVENIHRNGILDITRAPAEINQALEKEAICIARQIMDALDYVGVMAVEFFVLKEGRLLVNEFAPRPHNSGHWTIDACCTDQFEQHIRSICGIPPGDPTMFCRAEMKNLLGLESDDWNLYLKQPSTKLHLYGKEDSKPGRKMGHVTKTMSF